MTLNRRVMAVAGLVLFVVLLLVIGRLPPADDGSPRRGSSVPILAYYYIWFTPESWDRAKSDTPLLGEYSSDDRAVMERHVERAQAAGIDGFIVSWKSTATLDRRLATLVDVARQAHFKLGIIYQGLDFDRAPLAVEKVDADLRSFLRKYGDDPVFDIFGPPLVIWSGTWEFGRDDVAAVSRVVRPELLLLGSERDVLGIRRLSGIVDGQAYYWSSVDPGTQSGYRERLSSMATAAHEDGEIWIAPAAPGFDARLLGGTRAVPRDDGKTLRIELDAALSSAPDAIGLISWNEFSENSHLEPSVEHGELYLDVLREYVSEASRGEPIDSSDEDVGEPPLATDGTEIGRAVAVGFVIALILGGVVLMVRRGSTNRG